MNSALTVSAWDFACNLSAKTSDLLVTCKTMSWSHLSDSHTSTHFNSSPICNLKVMGLEQLISRIKAIK